MPTELDDLRGQVTLKTDRIRTLERQLADATAGVSVAAASFIGVSGARCAVQVLAKCVRLDGPKGPVFVWFDASGKLVGGQNQPE